MLLSKMYSVRVPEQSYHPLQLYGQQMFTKLILLQLIKSIVCAQVTIYLQNRTRFLLQTTPPQLWQSHCCAGSQ